MIYEKCRKCRFRCRCCSSNFSNRWPKCSKCEGLYDEFEPAEHMIYCPIDGKIINHPLRDVNGNIVRE